MGGPWRAELLHRDLPGEPCSPHPPEEAGRGDTWLGPTPSSRFAKARGRHPHLRGLAGFHPAHRAPGGTSRRSSLPPTGLGGPPPPPPPLPSFPFRAPPTATADGDTEPARPKDCTTPTGGAREARHFWRAERGGAGRGGADEAGGSGRGRRRPPPPFGARFLRRGAAAASCSSPRRVGRAALPWLPWRPFQTRQPAAGGNVWGSLPPLARPGPRAGVRQGGQRPAGLRWPWRPPCWAPAKRGGGLLLSLRCKRAVFFLGRRFCSLPSPSPGEKACSGLLSP